MYSKQEEKEKEEEEEGRHGKWCRQKNKIKISTLIYNVSTFIFQQSIFMP
jgi:hypothetical protein